MGVERFCYPEGKTNYQIVDENGCKTTITLDKWVADILQVELSDVHGRVQNAFDKVAKENPLETRRARGDIVREMATNTANQFQDTKKKNLGWNDKELFDAL